MFHSSSTPVNGSATEATHHQSTETAFKGNGVPPKPHVPRRDPVSGLVDQWHSQPTTVRVIHVGAGATGLCTAYKMRNKLQHYELVCYEKNDSIGGTWFENTYPGCACDVPAHVYTYTFLPNPKWSSYYAYSPEILEYFQKFYHDQNLEEFVKLKHKVLGAKWHEDKGQWEVEIEHGGCTFTDWCHILMNGSGLLNRWRWPDIKGLHLFKGPLMHSAHWDASIDYSGKRVAVLGTGSSSIQIVPQVQKAAQKVDCFLRSPTWIAPPMPRVPVETPTPEHPIPEEIPNPLVQQYFYKEHEIKHLEDNPEHHLKYRKQIEFAINRGFSIFYKGTEASRMAESYMRSEMIKRLGNHAELIEKLIPSWPVGCRRLTPGDGYLEALIQPNMECHFNEIECIDETGLSTSDGHHHEVDIIICATGFDMAWIPHFKLIGVNGIDIKKAWSPVPQSYLGIAAPGFPNYWVMNGPRGNLGNGTVLPCFEVQIEYVIEAAKKMQTERIRAMDVRADVTEKLNEYVDKWMETSVFSGKCRSWYKNNTVDGKVMCWGGSSIHYLKTLKTPRWEHYNIRYLGDDPWGFLGNGRIKAEVEDDFEGMTSYIRNSDHPWELH
ncbi:FAD/NAD(P)-binding domain-containing protein [Zopfia rhizophila CBS 207.26]|uniref:FAD/NAD(P)-binding domain-containing protein n=1 Tax=Zopfia rhizophila CBS 207.26 TaxID=1314779 RepID=A0A6A6DP19_9PEZI|nr:FAD/NAD(P)-binding domain-containing protein [Zopfia rhizophila CBS 207.26]